LKALRWVFAWAYWSGPAATVWTAKNLMAWIEKAKRKARRILVSRTYGARIYPYLYPAYWYSKIAKPGGDLRTLYFAARPNPGAGIGHQIANWIAGYWFAGRFALPFAHIPFSSPQWEDFLGFGYGETTVGELTNNGYKVRRLPRFDEDNDADIRRIQSIIRAYAGKRVVFLAEQDQYYREQVGVIDRLQKKFYSAPARQRDRVIFTPDSYNIAVHIRRGDIVQRPNQSNPNLGMRYQSNSYFVSALRTALSYASSRHNIHIYLFSQGVPEDFPEFKEFANIHFCLDMNARDSFLHMVFADALITSRSGFSFFPALLSHNTKFFPQEFWHSYPCADNCIVLDETGSRLAGDIPSHNP
jgi:hypothetical protein